MCITLSLIHSGSVFYGRAFWEEIAAAIFNLTGLGGVGLIEFLKLLVQVGRFICEAADGRACNAQVCQFAV